MSRLQFLLAVGGGLALVRPTIAAEAFDPVGCQGAYPGHLQGIDTDRRDAVYWSFTKALVKTDRMGQPLKQIDVPTHHGDICFHDGKVYVAVNFGLFNDAAGKSENWMYVYDADDLALLARHPLPEVVYGAGGVGVRDGRFFVVGGLPPDVAENYVHEYDSELRFVKRHTIDSGNTLMGIQTAAFVGGRWYFGCYGRPPELIVTDADFTSPRRTQFDCGYGVADAGDGKLLIGRGARSNGGWKGSLLLATPDEQQGLRLLDAPSTSAESLLPGG